MLRAHSFMYRTSLHVPAHVAHFIIYLEIVALFCASRATRYFYYLGLSTRRETMKCPFVVSILLLQLLHASGLEMSFDNDWLFHRGEFPEGGQNCHFPLDMKVKELER